ncbi:MAG: hypothetical protein WDZ26_02595 [Nitriliruptoraceae bacterium]
MLRVPAGDLVDLLACPHCRGALHVVGQTLACAAGHTFDVARQGYVSLFAGASRLEGDSTAMIGARERVEEAGLLASLAHLVIDVVCRATQGQHVRVVLDAGGGTGHLLDAVLDAVVDQTSPQDVEGPTEPVPVAGLVVDLSAPALRRAARRRPSIVAVRCDLRARWPVADRSVDVVLDVFAPRNPAEVHRVLRPTGALVVVTPGSGHLAEVAGAVGLVTVDPDKDARVDGQFSPAFVEQGRDTFEIVQSVAHDLAVDLVAMGPAGVHAEREEIAARLGPTSGTRDVTFSWVCRWYRPREHREPA